MANNFIEPADTAAGLVRPFIGTLMVVVLLVGCGSRAEEQKMLRDGNCWYRGNRADRIYCVTTYARLLAFPERYDGRLISIQGRATAGSTVELFPSLDSAEGAEIQASLRLVDGDDFAELQKYLNLLKWDGAPRRVIVSGLFKMNPPVPLNRAEPVSMDVLRLGTLDVEEFGL